jgi:hypothetical protein
VTADDDMIAVVLAVVIVGSSEVSRDATCSITRAALETSGIDAKRPVPTTKEHQTNTIVRSINVSSVVVLSSWGDTLEQVVVVVVVVACLVPATTGSGGFEECGESRAFVASMNDGALVPLRTGFTVKASVK